MQRKKWLDQGWSRRGENSLIYSALVRMAHSGARRARDLQTEVSTADTKPDGAVLSLSAITTFGRSPEPNALAILWPRPPEARFADRGPDDPESQTIPAVVA